MKAKFSYLSFGTFSIRALKKDISKLSAVITELKSVKSNLFIR